MNSKNLKAGKTGKAFIASAVGVCLLLGGSTYALWSANATVNSEATITAGDLRVSSASSNNWFDVSKPASPVELLDLSEFYMVPGDKLQLDQDMNLIIVGDNISGKLTVELPNSTESASLLAQAKFTVKIFNPDGEEIASITPATNSNKIEAVVENLEPTAPTGATYGVQVQVDLPAGADNATKLQASVLQDAIITLEQGGKYVAPAPIPEVWETVRATDFNDGSTSGFSNSQTGGSISVASFPSSSNKSLNVVGSGNAGAGANLWLSGFYVPGEKYRVTVDIYNQVGISQVMMGTSHNANSVIVESSVGQWETLTIDFVAIEARAVLSILGIANSTGKSAFYIDNFKIEKLVP